MQLNDTTSKGSNKMSSTSSYVQNPVEPCHSRSLSTDETKAWMSGASCPRLVSSPCGEFYNWILTGIQDDGMRDVMGWPSRYPPVVLSDDLIYIISDY